MTRNNVSLVLAAGGNGTAIETLDGALARAQYASRGSKLGEALESKGAEQAGFLIPELRHFEMAGGEFCGNASRAAALLLSNIFGTADVRFTVSGFDGTVDARVTRHDGEHSFVRCTFPGMPTNVTPVTLSGGQPANVVDLGGIVHVVIDGPFPEEDKAYEAAHRAIMDELGLSEREAVGVIWYEKTDAGVVIHPVVWVRDVNTFFYETSCGSGTIATAKVTGQTDIVQPTGQTIQARVTDTGVELSSEMEVVH